MRSDRSETVVLDTRVVTGTGGGPEKTILNSPRFLLSGGYRMLCAYMHPPGDAGFDVLRQRAEIFGAPLLSVADRGPWDWSVIAQLLSICRRERVAIWHGHDYKSNLLGLLVRRFWPMRLVTTVHGWVAQNGRVPLYHAIDRLCLPYYERVLCVSQDLREQCLAAGVPPRRCLLLENGIDIRQYTRSLATAQAKTELGFPTQRFLIGAVGRLAGEKGFDVLIRAVHGLLQAGHDVALMIAGDGNEKRRLKAMIARRGLDDRVDLLGYRADTIKLFEAMDVFALSSIHEGFPNALLEAMAMRVPVVATRVGGVPEIIQHEVNGLLVEPRNAPQLAGSLLRLIADVALRERLAQAAHHTVVQRYSFTTRLQTLGRLYDSLLAERGNDHPYTN